MNVNKRLLHGCVIATLLGCGGTNGPSIATDQLRPLRTLSPADESSAGDSLEARMNSIREQMEQAGLQRGAIWERGFIPNGSRETLRLEIPANTCATIVALASSGIRDVDAVLYLPDGTQVAQDGQPDSHPTLQVCTEGEGRYFYYTLHAYEGAGAYLVASFLSERALFSRAAAIVGGRPGRADEVEVSPEQQVVQTFGEMVQRRGFARMKDPMRVVLVAGQSVRVGVTVETARCYTVAAFALDGLQDVNVRVRDDNDHDVAFDTSESADAATQFCATRDAQFSAELTAARGQGAAVVALYAVAEAELGGNSGLWLGERANEQLSRVPLEDVLRDEAIAAGELGYASPVVRNRGRVVMGEVVAHPIHLKASSCTRVAASGGEGTGVLRLELPELPIDVAPRVTRRSDATVEVCATRATEIQALVISRRGYGDYVLSVATKSN